MEPAVPEAPRQPGLLAWLKKRLPAIGGLLVSVAIVTAIILVYKNNPDLFTRLQGYGYAGAFVISAVLNGTIIFPVSNMAVMMALGATMPLPWLVGVAGGAGAAVGEMTGYLVGRSGRGILARSRVYSRMELWVKKWGWLAVFFLSVIPFAFDVVGLIAGALRMPVWRFFIACWLGRTVSYVFMVYMASLGLKVLPWFG